MEYLWLKAFHLMAIVTWFSGLFYLPRLYVYHAETTDDAGNERFKIMERKLYRGITTPSMVVVVALGLWLISLNASYYLTQPWMHAKLTLVALLIAYHFACGYYRKVFAEDRNTRSHKFYRVFNELPVFALIGIIILVVVKPFSG